MLFNYSITVMQMLSLSNKISRVSRQVYFYCTGIY